MPSSESAKSESTASDSAEQSLHRLHLWHIQAVRDVAVIAGVVLLVMAGYWLRSVTVPLLLALALAYVVEPLVSRLTDDGKTSRPLVVGGLVALFGLAVLAFILIVLPLLFFQTRILLEDIGTYATNLGQYLADGQNTLSDIFGEDVVPRADPEEYAWKEQLQPWIEENLSAIVSSTIDTTGGALRIIASVIGSIFYIAFLAFLIPFFFFSISVSWVHLRNWVMDVYPEKHAARFYELIRKMDLAVSAFIRGRILIALIVGVMLAVGWGLCGVPFWLGLGMLSGILFIVPYLGGIGWPIAILLLWLDQNSAASENGQSMSLLWIILWPTIVFIIVQIVESYILTPVIAGKATNLGPVAILVAVLAGGAVGGAYGMLLAIPVAACLRILMAEVMIPRFRAWAEGRAEDLLPIARE